MPSRHHPYATSGSNENIRRNSNRKLEAAKKTCRKPLDKVRRVAVELEAHWEGICGGFAAPAAGVDVLAATTMAAATAAASAAAVAATSVTFEIDAVH